MRSQYVHAMLLWILLNKNVCNNPQLITYIGGSSVWFGIVIFWCSPTWRLDRLPGRLGVQWFRMDPFWLFQAMKFGHLSEGFVPTAYGKAYYITMACEPLNQVLGWFLSRIHLGIGAPQKKCLDPKITASQTIRSFSCSFFYLYFPGLNLGDARPLAVATMKKVWLLQLECWSSMPPVRNQKWLKIEMWPHEFLEFWTPSLRKDMLNLSKVQKLPPKHETSYNLWYSRSSCRSSLAISFDGFFWSMNHSKYT